MEAATAADAPACEDESGREVELLFPLLDAAQLEVAPLRSVVCGRDRGAVDLRLPAIAATAAAGLVDVPMRAAEIGFLLPSSVSRIAGGGRGASSRGAGGGDCAARGRRRAAAAAAAPPAGADCSLRERWIGEAAGEDADVDALLGEVAVSMTGGLVTAAV